jgi:hypothetical protein
MRKDFRDPVSSTGNAVAEKANGFHIETPPSVFDPITKKVYHKRSKKSSKSAKNA